MSPLATARLPIFIVLRSLAPPVFSPSFLSDYRHFFLFDWPYYNHYLLLQLTGISYLL